MSILLGGKASSDVAAVWAEEPPAVAPAPDKATPAAADPATQASLVAFLRDYHHALVSGNAPFLTEHTVFPLPIAEIEYDMEVKTRHTKLANVAALVHAKQRMRWPTELVPKEGQDLGRLRRGTQNCGDSKSPDKPNFSHGEPAIQLHGDEATLTYLAEPCGAETHLVTLSFTRTGQTWRLHERAVRKGTK